MLSSVLSTTSAMSAMSTLSSTLSTTAAMSTFTTYCHSFLYISKVNAGLSSNS